MQARTPVFVFEADVEFGKPQRWHAFGSAMVVRYSTILPDMEDWRAAYYEARRARSTKPFVENNTRARLALPAAEMSSALIFISLSLRPTPLPVYRAIGTAVGRTRARCDGDRDRRGGARLRQREPESANVGKCADRYGVASCRVGIAIRPALVVRLRFASLGQK